MSETLLDTNAVLRYLLRDNEEMAERVRSLIEHKRVLLRYEVAAEVAYVLTSVYKQSAADTAATLRMFIATENVCVSNRRVLLAALDLFAEGKLDFVDCILCAFNTVNGNPVFSFDKDLNKRLRP